MHQSLMHYQFYTYNYTYGQPPMEIIIATYNNSIGCGHDSCKIIYNRYRHNYIIIFKSGSYSKICSSVQHRQSAYLQWDSSAGCRAKGVAVRAREKAQIFYSSVIIIITKPIRHGARQTCQRITILR